MSKPTLIDVGKEAGVSPITVSRALRSPEKVSSALRDKIDKAIKKLGYIPNRSASNLASQKSNVVVVVIPSISNHVFSDVLRGIDEALRNSQYTLQIANSGYSALNEEKIIREFLNPLPVGIILTGSSQTETTKALLDNIEVPIVQIMEVLNNPIDRAVGFCHKSAGYTATQHLIDSQYKNVGFIGAQMDPRSQLRFSGFKHALQSAKMFQEKAVITTLKPSSVHMGAHLFLELINRYSECDAVFCNNDDLALGVLFECQRRNIRVPQDFGICGFNNLGITGECFPTLTSVATPLYEIGKTAGDIIMQNDTVKSLKTINLTPHLITRESTERKFHDYSSVKID